LIDWLIDFLIVIDFFDCDFELVCEMKERFQIHIISHHLLSFFLLVVGLSSLLISYDDFLVQNGIVKISVVCLKEGLQSLKFFLFSFLSFSLFHFSMFFLYMVFDFHIKIFINK